LLGFDTLIFPDTGREFIGALKTAVLYSDHVYVNTRISPLPEEAIRAFAKATGIPPTRANSYFEFVAEHAQSFSALESAGVLENAPDPLESIQTLSLKFKERDTELWRRSIV